MSKAFYLRLAITNIKKNSKTYLPYILTCIGTVAMFYMISSLSQNPGIGSGTVTSILKMAVVVTGVFAATFLFYTNSFLMKRRKKEFGLYNILGMEKRHISRIILGETAIITLISIVGGMAAGLLLDKVIFLALIKLLNFKVTMGFYISGTAVITTIILFCLIFLAIFLNSFRQVYKAKPIELLKGGNVGEREPKTKWLMTLLGVICLGIGYYIAIATTNPLKALYMFLVAVLFVIAGTYLLFTTGSIALLKFLRKNKTYYYQTKHFFSVSGMMYRMKQNAVGLANICILSTAVLVMISSTLSLYIGIEDTITARYPREFLFSTADYSNENISELDSWIGETAEAEKLTATNELRYTYLSFYTHEKGGFFDTSTLPDSMLANGNFCNLFFMTVADYNKMTGKSAELRQDEVIVFSNGGDYAEPTMRIFDMTFNVKEKTEDTLENGMAAANVATTYAFAVKDTAIMEKLMQKQSAAYGEEATPIKYYYGFDLATADGKTADTAAIKAVLNKIYDSLGNKNEFQGHIECRDEALADVYELYGGLFFIGIFLGILFLMATILIIYYKQVSEGYDDRERFEIMQKVGMNRDEIKKSIRSQVLTVFFLPLVTAAIHIAVAFPVITRLLALLAMLQQTNVVLFAICTVASLGVFALLYALVYSMTARVYYKIVS